MKSKGDGGDYRTVVTDPQLAPPMLTPEGAKVQPDWLYAFLQGPITIRPWLNVRMPTFGLDDGRWNAIIDYFEATGNSIGPFRTYDHAELTSMAAPGRELFDAAAVPEVPRAWERYRPTSRPSNLAPDLRMTHERLQARVDSAIGCATRAGFSPAPGCRSSGHAAYPKSAYPQLGGDAEPQMRAIRDHLMTLRGGPSPTPPAPAQSTN